MRKNPAKLNPFDFSWIATSTQNSYLCCFVLQPKRLIFTRFFAYFPSRAFERKWKRRCFSKWFWKCSDRTGAEKKCSKCVETKRLNSTYFKLFGTATSAKHCYLRLHAAAQKGDIFLNHAFPATFTSASSSSHLHACVRIRVIGQELTLASSIAHNCD